jgi:hypothetical protein
MLAVAWVSPAALAVIVELPMAIAVTGTGADVAPWGTITGVGTVTTPVLLELSETLTPPVPAAAGSVTVRF